MYGCLDDCLSVPVQRPHFSSDLDETSMILNSDFVERFFDKGKNKGEMRGRLS